MKAANNPAIPTGQPAKGAGVGQHLLERIGKTPLLRFERTGAEFSNVEICAKAEWFNPGGSVKDRAALAIIEDAERRGTLRKGGVIVEGTAGNTGIGLTVIGNALGFRSVIVIPETQSKEKKDALRLLGALLSRRRSGKAEPSA